MSEIVLGCDRNNGNDSTWQNTVAKVLEKAGHTVEKLTIGPNYFASYSYSGKSKGKIGVFLIAAGLTALCDLYDGNTNFKYAYFGIRGDIGNGISSMNDFNTKGIHKDHHGDCISKSCDPFNGKTYPQINEITKAKCAAVYGGTAEEMGNNIIKAMGGDVGSDGSSSSSSTIKSAICDVMYNWDGEAELFIRDETIHIQKIRSPLKAKLSLIEGKNVHSDSITINDYNPSTVNYLTCIFKDYELTIQDEVRVKRFGKVPSEVSIEDENIKTLDDAKDFLQREWNKLQRDNDHSLECTVQGNVEWKVGEWCRVYLPSFDIDDYMYIINMSQEDSASDKWKCNLTLVDYPPGFGEPSVSEENSEDESTDSDATDEEDVEAEST